MRLLLCACLAVLGLSMASNVAAAQEKTLTGFQGRGAFYPFKNPESTLETSIVDDAKLDDGKSIKVDYELIGGSAFGGIGCNTKDMGEGMGDWSAQGAKGGMVIVARASAPETLSIRLMADRTYTANIKLDRTWKRFTIPFSAFVGSGVAFDPTDAGEVSKIEIRPSGRGKERSLLIDEIALTDKAGKKIDSDPVK